MPSILRSPCILGMLLAVAILGAPRPARAAVVELRAGTPVRLSPVVPISTHLNQSGQGVVFSVVDPVGVNGVIIIPAGAVARGSVVFARGAGIGHGSKLLVSVDVVQAMDGSWIPLRTTPQAQPGDHVLSQSDIHLERERFLRGHDRIIHGGVPITVYVEESRRFSLASFEGTAQAEAWNPSLAELGSGRRLLRVADGTPIIIRPTRTLSSGGLSPGRRLDFVMAAPLMVGGVTIVDRGAPVRGTVLFAHHSELFGGRGELAFDIDSVRTVNGTWLNVHATAARTGGGFSIPTPPGLSTVESAALLVLPGTEARVLHNRVLTFYVNGDHYFIAEKVPGTAGKYRLVAVP